jgi:hypothetical protein
MRRLLLAATLLLVPAGLTSCSSNASAIKLDDRTFKIEGPGVPGGAEAPNRRLGVQAFAAGMDAFLGGKSAHRLLGREEATLAKFDTALQALNKAIPGVKRRVVVACASCILADDQVTVREVEVLRAICDRLDCPMPPLLVGEVEGP